MDTTLIAQIKLKNLTSRTERKLYELKFAPNQFRELNDEVYKEVLNICSRNKIPFPLLKTNDGIFLNGAQPKLFSTLHRLADEYGIILDFTKII